MTSSTNLIELYDTTLRDGTQGEHINLSVQDKLLIAQKLDEFGMNYIEGGWPSSNPKDEEFFLKARQLRFNHAKLCAFGSTARSVSTVSSDPNLLGYGVWPHLKGSYVPSGIRGEGEHFFDGMAIPIEMFSCESQTGDWLHVDVWQTNDGRYFMRLYTSYS